MKRHRTLIGLALAFVFTGCSAGPVVPSTTQPSAPLLTETSPTPILQVEPSTAADDATGPVPAATLPSKPPPVQENKASPPEIHPSPVTTLVPKNWQDLPIVPTKVDPRMKEVYQQGLELGNNPRAFSKIGDCGSTPAWFLGDFDLGPKVYRLGEHQALQETIEYYQGSFGRTSLAAKSGFNASSVFTVLWANRQDCEPSETPLACELRVHQPALALIMLGTNDVWHMDSFEPQMRKIIEYSLEQGVIPVLSTKADNIEKDGRVNATIASLALEYGLPLWNYWRAVQPLPDQGLQDDAAHITWAPNRFDDPEAMQKGWPVRNLTALQVLDILRRELSED